MADMKLSLDIRITRNKAQLEILQQSQKHINGRWAGQVRHWQKATKTTELSNAMCDMKTSRRLEPILLRSSATGKTNTLGVHVHVAQFNLGGPSAGNPPFLKFVLLAKRYQIHFAMKSYPQDSGDSMYCR